MAFDPDAWLAQKRPKDPPRAFDPDAYLKRRTVAVQQQAPRVGDSDPMTAQEQAANAKPEGPGRLASAMLGAGQGSTFGFVDEAAGALDVPVAKGKQLLRALGIMGPEERISDEIQQPGALVSSGGRQMHRAAPSFVPDSGRADPGVGEIYAEGRDAARRTDKIARDANPGFHTGGELLGALVAPVPKVAPAAQGAKLLSRMAAYGKQGAKVGAAYGAGKSEAKTLDEFGRDVQGGAVLGGVTGAVAGPAVERGGEALSEHLRRAAADKAFRAMNGNAKIKNKARDLGYKTDEEMRELGRWALDNGLIPWSGDAAVIVERVGAMLDDLGPKIGKIVDKADEAVLTGGANGGMLKPLADYKSAHKAAKGATAPMAGNRPGGLAATDMGNTGPAEGFISDVLTQEKMTPGSFRGMFQQKIAAQEGVNWADKAKAAKRIHRDAVQRYTKDFQRQVGEEVGPEALAEMRALNRAYGSGADVAEFATEAATRAQQHKYRNALANALMLVGPGGAAGAALGSPEVAAMGMGLSAVAKSLNNPGLMSRADDAASKALSGRGGDIANTLTAPEVQAIIDYLRRR